MPRERNPNRDRALEIYKEYNGEITNRRIAELIGENEKVVAVWKQRDKWNVVQQSKTKVVQQKRHGAPPGNKNAKGNRGGHGGPQGNDRAVKHGFFRRIFPDDEETHAIIGEIQIKSPADILWENIVIQYTAIARAQRIMFVRDKEDKTREVKKDMETGTEYEIQFAWDKQASLLQAQSRAIATLEKLLSSYEEMLAADIKNEKRMLELEKIKHEIAALKRDEDEDSDDDDGLESLAKAISDSKKLLAGES